MWPAKSQRSEQCCNGDDRTTHPLTSRKAASVTFVQHMQAKIAHVCVAAIVAAGAASLTAATLQISASASLETLEVRPSFFVVAGAGANVGVQVGDDGLVVVDAGSPAGASGVLASIRRISPKPI